MEINPADAASSGIREGDKVAIETSERLLPGVARYDSSLPRGVVGLTGLFGQLAIEMEASQEPNPAAMLGGLEIRPARLVRTEH